MSCDPLSRQNFYVFITEPGETPQSGSRKRPKCLIRTSNKKIKKSAKYFASHIRDRIRIRTRGKKSECLNQSCVNSEMSWKNDIMWVFIRYSFTKAFVLVRTIIHYSQTLLLVKTDCLCSDFDIRNVDSSGGSIGGRWGRSPPPLEWSLKSYFGNQFSQSSYSGVS